MDQIIIEDLEVFANHGVLEEETRLGQKFLVSVTINTDFSGSSTTDDLNNTVNYAAVAKDVNEFMTSNTYKLLETCAKELGTFLILKYKSITEIIVKINKPWAPVGLPLKNVGVCTTLKWHTAFLALGSNIGNREENIKAAITGIDNDAFTSVIKISELINTKPYGYKEQDDFLNCAIKVKTLRSPYELLKLANEIEKKLYRERTIHWGPRTIDVDIIFYDDIVMDDDELTIPHKEMHLRDFVLIPLSQIGAGVINRVWNKSVAQLLKECEKNNVIK